MTLSEWACPRAVSQSVCENADMREKVLENGSSIRPYLSNRVNELYSVDGLLLDWGIHHLHFTSCYSKDKIGNDILFIVEEDEKIHFITILLMQTFIIQTF